MHQIIADAPVYVMFAVFFTAAYIVGATLDDKEKLYRTGLKFAYFFLLWAAAAVMVAALTYIIIFTGSHP